ncbi:MAG TPA: hypothetical protein VFP37_10435 [Steroidobacteraceae bacterium]|nr:hypothetical protein [Steroidobacteraceae bacterium]
MTGPDDEFDDFLSRRKPLFRRGSEEPFGPPEEIDRIVLRQAREAIESDRPQRVFRGMHWGAPLAIAATLLVTFAVVMHATLPKNGATSAVTLQQASQAVEPAAASAPAEADAGKPEWRRDAQSWLKHIEQLRSAGRSAEADAEMAEYQRAHRALATAPDR